jgi:chromosome segregation ATPase
MYRIRLLGLATGIAFLLGVNLVYVGVQNLEKRDDRVRLSKLEVELGAKRSAMREMESWLKEMTLELSSSGFQIRTLQSKIESFNKKHPDGIPSELQADYAEAVEQHNALATEHNAAVAKYDALYADYSELIGQHNAIANQVETLEQRLGTTLYFLPLPKTVSFAR